MMLLHDHQSQSPAWIASTLDKRQLTVEGSCAVHCCELHWFSLQCRVVVVSTDLVVVSCQQEAQATTTY